MNSSKCHLAKARFVVGHQLDQLGMNSLALRLRINENRLENGSSALFGTSWISLGPLGREMLSESKLKDLLHRLRISSLRLMKTNWDWMLWVMSLGGCLLRQGLWRNAGTETSYCSTYCWYSSSNSRYA
ncbi:hypothetical protein CUMW_109200 [Citrus unshiu]|nr:hypothetical protein CUMW_109200 [Citrus unshiu]GAY48091.1 hypothetical protein CUMW_109200 [Citrus unshiu]